MDDKKNDLTALLALYEIVYKRIDYYENKSNNDYIGFFAIIGIIVTVGHYINWITISAIFLPLVSILSFYRFAFFTRFVAYLRGYAANIEMSINYALGKQYYINNAILIDKFISPKNFKTNKASIYVCVGEMLAPAAVSFGYLYMNYWPKPLATAIISIYVIFYIMCIYLFAHDSYINDQIRKSTQDFTVELFDHNI